MRVPLLLIIGSMYILQTGQQTTSRVWDPYDCRRLNSHCAEGICESADGTCNCDGGIPPVAGREGFDCTLVTAEISVSGCTGNSCMNGGTCFTRTTSDLCYCSEEYTGSRCEQKRVDVTVCNGTHFGIYIKPHRENLFRGDITIIKDLDFNREELLSNIPECVAVQQPDLSYQLITTTDDTNPCGEALQRSNITNGEQFVYKVRVNYRGQGIQTAFDETHEFTCQVTTDGTVAGLTVGDTRPGFSGANVTSVYKPAAIEIVERTGDAVSSSTDPTRLFYVGQTLFVRVFLKEGTRYSKLAVDECASHPEMSSISDRTIVFLEGRCPRQDALYLIDSSVGTVRQNDSSVLVAIYAIKYSPSSQFYISCNVTLCTDQNSAECDPYNCSSHLGGPGSGAGRRKREAASAENQYVIAQGIVLDSKAQYDALRPRSTQEHEIRYIYRTVEEPCLHNPLFVFVLCALGLFFILSLTLLVLFCYRRMQIKKTTKELM